MRKSSKGLSIVELVVASAILALFLTAIAYSYTSFLKLAFANIKSVKATFLAEEGIEVVKFLRDSDWEENISPLISNQDYYLNFTGSTWGIVSVENPVDGLFYRKLIFEDVFRDSNGRIVEAGGTLDQETKKLTVYLSWPSGTSTTTKSVSTYISNI